MMMATGVEVTGGVISVGIGVEVPLAAAGLKAAPYARHLHLRKPKTPCAPSKRAPLGLRAARDPKALRLKRAPIAPNAVPVNN